MTKRKVTFPKKKKSNGQSSVPKRQVKVKPPKQGSLARDLLTLLGSAGGGILAGPTGASAGSTLGNMVATWLGAGDYTINANTLVSASVPAMHNNNMSILVRHKEYIGDVNSSAAGANTFNTTVYPINPGLSSTFPWLAALANNFQEWSLKGMVFEYRTISGSAISGTNTTLGSVMMATQYNSVATIPIDKPSLLNEAYSSSSRPNESFVHPIECAPRENPNEILYVRSGSAPANADIRLFDIGQLIVATDSFQATGVHCGELWCSYEVELHKPIANSINQVGLGFAHYNNSNYSTANPFGTVTRHQFSDNIGLTLTDAGKITFPKGLIGNYLVVCYWQGATACSAMSLTPTNCTGIGMWNSDTQAVATTLGTTMTNCMGAIEVTCSTVNLTASVQIALTVTGTAYVDILVYEVSGVINNTTTLP